MLGRIVVLIGSSGCLNKGSGSLHLVAAKEFLGRHGGARENSCSLLYKLVPVLLKVGASIQLVLPSSWC